MKGLWYLIMVGILLGSVSAVSAQTDQGTGGDMGWYVIHCNVYDSNVYLDGRFVGTILQGTLTVPALTTGAYKTLTVKKNGYTTYNETISVLPGKGMSVDLYATLNPAPDATPTSVGGDMGWYIVRSNVDGATVYFDGVDKGTVTAGMLYVPVYVTATPYREYTVKKDGYTTFVGQITRYPAKAESIDLYATLNPTSPATATTPAGIGGDIGWYVVHSNVEGANVTFDNDPKGTISQGILRVQIYVTGTPYRNYTVSKSGYVPFTGMITQYPAKGETIDLPGTLAVATPTQTPSPKSPLPLGVTGLALVLGMICVIRSAGKKR
jgi:hypothetical protein